ncbi:hypothetical protein V7122_18205 [Bacillus sp. JJ1532]|uniref:hypothetical protein n=1 Tax=Bacillus sp. JJ1532 TaxID=3122958 RepID=UPI002FFE2D48
MTGLFAIAGFTFKVMYLSFLSDNGSIDEAVKLLLFYQIKGKPLDLESITSVAKMLHYSSNSAGYALESIFVQDTTRSALLFGFIGFILSFLVIPGNLKNKFSDSSQSVFPKILNFIFTWRKDIVFSLVIILLAGYLSGMAGYYFKQFSINQDKAVYYQQKFKEQYGEDRYPEVEPYVSSFLKGEYYIVDGATLYESELTKGKTKIFGYLLGIILVLYRNRSKIVNMINIDKKLAKAN